MNSLYPFAPRRTISDICTTAKPLKNISYLNAAHGIILHPSIRKHIPPRSLFLKDSVLFHSIQRDRGGSSTPLQALLSLGKERQTLLEPAIIRLEAHSKAERSLTCRPPLCSRTSDRRTAHFTRTKSAEYRASITCMQSSAQQEEQQATLQDRPSKSGH